MATVAVWLTLLGRGPFTHDAVVDDLLELQLMLAAVSGTMLVLVGAIAERDRSAAALMKARQLAEQANLAKSQFVAAVRHDLAQPLQACQLFLGALREQVPGEPGQVLIEHLTGSMEAMGAGLDALRDITAVECNLMHPRIEIFPVAETLRQLAEEYRIQAAKCKLEFRSVGCSIAAETDRQLLARILRNLLSNAMRYTGAGRVLLGCRRVPGGVRIEVWDTGPGIPAAEQERIFEAFHRSPPLPSERAGPGDTGLGLGLATVRRLAGLLGLTVTLRSKIGRGSVFAIVVPAAKIDVSQDSESGEHLSRKAVWHDGIGEPQYTRQPQRRRRT